MSARFRRRGEIVEACQFTGENEEECRTVARFRHEVFTDLMSPGYWVWVDSAGCIHADSDERFRSSFEPVPLPEPAPADGWAETIAEIQAWQRATFTRATPESIAAHLFEEAGEVKAAPRDPEEVADALHLLIGLAGHCGYDLLEALRAKFAKNKARDWSAPPNEQGYVKAAPPVVEGGK